MPQGASVPALGRSNKAVFDPASQAVPDTSQVRIVEELYKENYFNLVDLESKLRISFEINE